MSYSKKTWTNRQSEYPNRRRLTPTGTAEVYEVAREEGLVVEEGDPFDQTSMNDLENRVAGAFGELVDGTVKAGKAVVSDSANAVAWGNVGGKPAAFPPSGHTHTKANITDFPASLPANGGTAAVANNALKLNNKAESALNVSYANGAGNADAVDSYHIWTGTQAQYNAIGSKLANTFYFIVG
ncbi:MAG: hypothetical protein RR528_03470 [Angelakisella sp.]